MKRRLFAVAAYLVAGAASLFFVYPFYWMIVSSFRTQEALFSRPLALLPEHWDLTAYRSILSIGGTDLSVYAINSLIITLAATIIGVVTMTLGAYALYREPRLPLFPSIRATFLLAIMYPNMLLAIPLYFVAFRLGILGSYTAIVLATAILPLVFFLFVQFFRTIPKEMVEAATVDGASEFQTLRYVIVPVAAPMMTTAALIAVLLNWKQWFHILVISTGPDTYNLPIALLSLNSEYGVNFQATMALATLTCLPVIVLFLLTQRRVMSGFLAGAVKG